MTFNTTRALDLAEQLEQADRAMTKRSWFVAEHTHHADPTRRRFRIMYTATDAYNLGAKFPLATVELYGTGNADDEANASAIAILRNLAADCARTLREAVEECERLRAEIEHQHKARAVESLGNEANRDYIDTLQAERDALAAEVERMRPVYEAALEWRKWIQKQTGAGDGEVVLREAVDDAINSAAAGKGDDRG